MTEEGVEKTKAFVPSKGLTTEEAQQLLLKWGRNELEDKKKAKVGGLLLSVFFVAQCLNSGSSLWNNCGNLCLL